MISLLISLVVLGLVVYLIELIPMDAGIAKVVRVVAIIIAIFMVLGAFGFGPSFGYLR